MSLLYDSGSFSMKGRALIESSAGTGKTYTIAELYVRLLLERKLRVEQMLVVTYTKAAVQELTDRIRDKIKEALRKRRAALPAASDGKTRDELESEARLLQDALRTFDLASIQTIHGFCQRALQDNAFESASLFDTEMVPDAGEIVRRAVNDFYLELAFREEPGWDALLRSRILGKLGPPEDAVPLVGKCYGNPFLKVETEAFEDRWSGSDAVEYTAAVERFFKAFSGARDALIAAGGMGKIVELLLDGSLKGNTYSKKYLPGHAADVLSWLEEDPSPPAPGKFSLFCRDEIEKKVNKLRLAPVHPVFERFTDLRQAVELLEPMLERAASAWIVRLRVEMILKAGAAIRNRKGRKNVRSYDDLLLDLHGALFGLPGEGRRELTANGKRLARALKGRYKAILIDEFQDTDPVQYEIFAGIFSDVSEDALFLVGDPKQSIYGFRGADLFAYRQARSEVPEERRFTLGRNYRAVPSLVRAVNAVFLGSQDPFVFDWIPFLPVEANRPETDGLGGPEAGGASSLVFWHLDKSDPAKEAVEKKVLRATAREIVRLLEAGACGKATFGGKPLLPRDVAVLVRTNQEARQVRDLLVGCGVPCVLYCNESVFASSEARIFAVLLAAVANPASERKVRAALSTDLFGWTGGDIDSLSLDEAAWEKRVQDFRRFRETWKQKGAAAMCRDVFSAGRVRSRLSSEPGGERALTNFLHLAELLQDFEAGGAGPEGTLAWLDARIAETDGNVAFGPEEHQLRLETDASAVKVVTVHKCKGLQYPVVFLPFAWRATGKRHRDDIEEKEGILYHDGDDPRRVVRRFDTIPDEVREMADREDLSENTRLFYVALTRAVARCYVAWGGVKGAGHTGAAWVLHGKRIGGSPAVFRDRIQNEGDDAIRADLDMLAEAAKEDPGAASSIRVEPLPILPEKRYVPVTVPGAAPLEVREFPSGRKIVSRFGETSFTALSREAENLDAGDPDAPDRDPALPWGAAATAVSPAARSIHDFPAGAKAGIFFHDLLEKVDFDATEDAVLGAARRLLPLHGLDEAWAEIVARRISEVLSLPLRGHGIPFCLSAISRADRLSEVRFAFPIRAFGGRGTAPGSFEGISFFRDEGLLKGAIDLVCRSGERFYLVDWKSNRLGPDAGHYSPERIREEMSSERYLLQADLYAVALHLYLKKRLRGYAFDRHFGGTFYLFLRGIDPMEKAGSGIWFDRPDERYIEGIAKALAGEGWGS